MQSCACGRVPAEGDRFCPGCGRAVVDAGAGGADPHFIGATGSASDPDIPAAGSGLLTEVGAEAGAEVGVEVGAGALLSANGEPASASASGEVRSGGSRVWLLVGLIVIVGLAAALFALPSGGGRSVGLDDVAAPLVEDDRPTAGPEGEAESPTTAGADEAPSGDADSDSVDDQQPPLEAGAGEPLLGEPTGLGLLIGRRSAITAVDLDTGDRLELEFGPYEPVEVVGTTLLLRSNQSDRYAVVDLAEPEAEPKVLDTGIAGWIEFGRVVDDTFWFFGGNLGIDGDTPMQLGFDLEGDLTARTELPDGTGFLQPALPGVVQALPGGVYEQQGDGYVRRSEGRVLAAGERLILIQSCDPQLECRASWLDRDSWQVQPDLWIPGAVDQFWGNSIGGDDRWLLIFEPRRGGHVVRDVRSGAAVTELGSFGPDGPFGGPAAGFSPDGRWLADREGGSGVVVKDLENDGQSWQIPTERSSGNGSLLLFDLSALGGLDSVAISEP